MQHCKKENNFFKQSQQLLLHIILKTVTNWIKWIHYNTKNTLNWHQHPHQQQLQQQLTFWAKMDGRRQKIFPKRVRLCSRCFPLDQFVQWAWGRAESESSEIDRNLFSSHLVLNTFSRIDYISYILW